MSYLLAYSINPTMPALREYLLPSDKLNMYALWAYLYPSEDRTALGLVLEGQNTIQWSLEHLQMHHKRAEQVRLVHYSEKCTIENRDLVKVTEQVAYLPRLEDVVIEFNSTLPICALTSLLKGLSQRHLLDTSSGWLSLSSSVPAAQVHSLKIRAPELGGNQEEMEELQAQLAQNTSLKHLHLHNECGQGNNNKFGLGTILKALQHHATLECLTLEGAGEWPLEDLVELVSNNKVLSQLEIITVGQNLAPLMHRLAQALAQASKTNLRKLRLSSFGRYVVDSEAESCLPEDPTFVQGMVALEDACETNYTLEEVYVALAGTNGNLLYERNWPKQSKSRFYTTLNQLGRKKLLCDPDNTSREDWIQAMADQSVGVNYYWLSRNPTLLPSN